MSPNNEAVISRKETNSRPGDKKTALFQLELELLSKLYLCVCEVFVMGVAIGVTACLAERGELKLAREYVKTYTALSTV